MYSYFYYLSYSLEITAFIASIYYLKKNRNVKSVLWLSLFLGFTVVVNSIGGYTKYISTYQFLSFLEDTPFKQNYWLYNIYYVLYSLFYTLFFLLKISNKRLKNVLKAFSLFYLVGSIYYLLFSGTYFSSFPPFSVIVGSVLVLTAISIYFVTIINTDKILNIKNSLHFYIAIGIVIWQLCATPLFIYSVHYKSFNTDFVLLRKWVVISVNILMYLLFTFGFIVCAKTKQNS